MEEWEEKEDIDFKIRQNSFKPIIPTLQYSIIPIGAKPPSSIDGLN
jgi:hypothetical protein